MVNSRVPSLTYWPSETLRSITVPVSGRKEFEGTFRLAGFGEVFDLRLRQAEQPQVLHGRRAADC